MRAVKAARIIHRCSACGSGFPRWAGRCAACGEWNTLVEERVASATSGAAPEFLEPVSIAAVAPGAGYPVPTGLAEFDRAFGGGLVAGSVTLIGGEPGIGKSTLLLQVAGCVARRGRVLIVAGEESTEQIARRARRLGLDTDAVSVLATGSLPAALAAAERFAPDLLVVDSIQTVADPETAGGAGSVVQVRDAAARVVRFAKETGAAAVLVGHVTKDGALAGPRVLEHLVDTVCAFEGDRHHALRILAVVKHRFGPAGELGIFTMTSTGLEAVGDPSELLLGDRRPGIAGGIVVPVLEGQRPLLVELQALVARSTLATPRRAVQGVAASRLAIALAVLEQRVGFGLSMMDVFVSVVGGVRVAEPAVDLALGLALASALSGRPVGDDVVACGEIGLGGEVRQVVHTERRLAEAARLGFTRAVVPASAPEPPAGMDLVRAATLADAVRLLGLGASDRIASSGSGPLR